MRIVIYVAKIAVCIAVFAGCQKAEQTQTVKISVLRHVVFFDFKDSTTPEQIKTVEDAFCALPTKLDLIKDFEWGTDVSVEGLAHNYRHCFFVTFASEEDRAIYLPHPEHTKFVELLKPTVEKVMVFDYWTK